MTELYELRWKTTFMFYFWKFSNFNDEDLEFWVEQCYAENHNGKHRILSPKQAAQEVVSWSRA
ncbi:MAG: hypothetical protein GJ680_18570 [Alteromonadaceae bacterium]|nr:hypothetical protein [Alteromonadaceae bacterium]